VNYFISFKNPKRKDTIRPNNWLQVSAVARTIIGGGGANIHISVFCFINFFWHQLFLWYVNTNIWIFAPPPPIIVLATALLQVNSELLYAIPWSPFWFWFHNSSFCGLPKGKPSVSGHHKWPHRLIMLTWNYSRRISVILDKGNSSHMRNSSR
jgi:hypothetical protein